jgi:hypothetical protein
LIKITEITAVKLEELLLKSSIPSASHKEFVFRRLLSIGTNPVCSFSQPLKCFVIVLEKQ